MESGVERRGGLGREGDTSDTNKRIIARRKRNNPFHGRAFHPPWSVPEERNGRKNSVGEATQLKFCGILHHRGQMLKGGPEKPPRSFTAITGGRRRGWERAWEDDPNETNTSMYKQNQGKGRSKSRSFAAIAGGGEGGQGRRGKTRPKNTKRKPWPPMVKLKDTEKTHRSRQPRRAAWKSAW